jgi:glycosyltransferase involved in cell wall biosynthesis
MTDEFLKYGEKYRKLSSMISKESFPFGYPKFILDEDQEIKSIKKFKDLGIDFDKFNIVYFGTIGKQFDFEPAIEIASKLEQDGVNFIFCGKGDSFENLRDSTKNIKNIIWTGWVDQGNIWTLMKYSKVGFAPYINSNNFLANLTNKPIEYLGGALPILSSIDGVLGKILKDNKCGFIYENAEELYKYILELKNNDNLRNNMSKNAIDVFNKKFSAEKVYLEMIEYLENIAKKYKENENDKNT